MATLRCRFVATLGVAVLLAAIFGGTAAVAQTAYPPSPTTTPVCVGGAIDAGQVAVGATITITLCGPFQPGSPVAVAVGPESLGTQTAGVNGTVIVNVTPGSCGANGVTATGSGTQGGTVTATATFSVTCAPSPSKGPLAYTGADILKLLLVALVLILIGAALVIVHRRRTEHAR